MEKSLKELLIKDLCARLPYSIKCYYNSPEIYDDVQDGISVIKGFQNEGTLVEIESGDVIDIDYVKPYLRPMSSMTEEERMEYNKVMFQSERYEDDYAADVDWLNEHHFDYRGMITMGLALEAPEGMYKNK